MLVARDPTIPLFPFLFLPPSHEHWSWDAVEPYTYFSNSAITVLAVLYFIVARRAPSLNSVDDHLRSTYAKKRYAEAGVDLDAYERLSADVRRYEKYAERLGAK